jgi:uncharacterized protein DUF6353
MTIKTVLLTAEKFVTNNSPGILTGLGVTGAVTTAVLATRAGYQVGMDASTQYHEALVDGEALPEHLLEPKHIVKTYWKTFIPAAAVGTVTIAAIVMANQIGARRAAAITAAFKLSEQLSEEYKERVVKTLGLKKEEEMRSVAVAERVAANPPSSMIIVAGSDVMMLDEMSGRYFTGQVEDIRKAVNQINFDVNNNFHASLTEFYNMIGLEPTQFSDELGWNTDELLDVQFTPAIYKDQPIIALNYNRAAIRGFDRLQ